MYIHRILFKKIDRRIRPEHYDHPKEVERWYRDGGDDHFRYDYLLEKDSIVIDAGGYEGSWTNEIYKRYSCNVFVFEPIGKYFNKIKRKFQKYRKIRVYRAGLAGKTRKGKMSIEDVGSSVYRTADKIEEVELWDIKKFLSDNKIKKVDLLKINIEGGEYELLERVLDTGLINNIRFIQVQFHNFFPDAEERMEKIQRRLSKTHRLTYQYWFVWDNWEKK